MRSMTARRSAPLAATAALLFGAAVAAQDESEGLERLGADLFAELLFNNQGTDYAIACSVCHALGESVAGKAERFYADYTPTSLTAGRETTARNAQTLAGVHRAEVFGWDGAYDSMEDMILEKLIGKQYGWNPEARDEAIDNAAYVLLDEGHNAISGVPYIEQFQEVYGLDLESLERPEVATAAARALADYTRTFDFSMTSRWDAFTEQNRFRKAPNADEDIMNYAASIESRIYNQEGRGLIRRPEGFTEAAYEGFKTFFRVFDVESVGNCVRCHVPPTFSDYSLHGAGSGRGRFKTPPLRNLPRTDPYLHDGSAATLEEVLQGHMALAEAARGEEEGVDPLFGEIRISEADIEALVQYLLVLDEVDPANFRYYLINFE